MAFALFMFSDSLDRSAAAKRPLRTASTFTSSARQTADQLSKRIVLIDGDQLTRLMIRHGVGCRVEAILYVKGVDEEFF
jgi:restriction system protein